MGATVTMTSSTLERNQAKKGNGGGVAATSSELTLRDTIISDNSAGGSTLDGRGGGLYMSKSAHCTMSNSSVTLNRAVAGAGIYINTNSSLTATFSMMQNNLASSDGNSIYCDPHHREKVAEIDLDEFTKKHMDGQGDYRDGCFPSSSDHTVVATALLLSSL